MHPFPPISIEAARRGYQPFHVRALPLVFLLRSDDIWCALEVKYGLPVWDEVDPVKAGNMIDPMPSTRSQSFRRLAYPFVHGGLIHFGRYCVNRGLFRMT